jgi:hypothetical protein
VRTIHASVPAAHLAPCTVHCSSSLVPCSSSLCTVPCARSTEQGSRATPGSSVREPDVRVPAQKPPGLTARPNGSFRGGDTPGTLPQLYTSAR